MLKNAALRLIRKHATGPVRARGLGNIYDFPVGKVWLSLECVGDDEENCTAWSGDPMLPDSTRLPLRGLGGLLERDNILVRALAFALGRDLFRYEIKSQPRTIAGIVYGRPRLTPKGTLYTDFMGVKKCFTSRSPEALLMLRGFIDGASAKPLLDYFEENCVTHHWINPNPIWDAVAGWPETRPQPHVFFRGHE